ncbi:alpha/beta fold hydrolase [Bradyrhizobium sp. 2TAF24]|uniref:alpha/beta fold hydrolase n=1 Tax=Bradyrhizobium sp. 2TAF24 TaxID=3233011 RepID=UPI003F93DAEB
MKTLTANGITIAYDDFGDMRAEPILLIAGLGTQMIRWTSPFCAALVARGYRVIRFDNRDAGGSTHFSTHPAPDFGALATALMAGGRPDVPYTLHDMAGDTVGLMDALAIPRAHLVGRSMGGMIAQVVASAHPDRALSLTSIMSSTGNPQLPQAAPDVMAMLTRPMPDPSVDIEGYLDRAQTFAQRITGLDYPIDVAAYRALVREEVRRAYDPAGFARQIAAIAITGDRRAALAAITAPTLVIHGADDPLIPPACGADTAAAIPGAEFMVIDGMGHDLPAAVEPRIADAIVRTAQRGSRLPVTALALLGRV